MSRICVKNLPRYVSDGSLREFFSQKGEVTDAKLMRTKDGKSRQFGFVGYRTEQEANEAISYFHDSFIDTCKIHCEIARKIGDLEIPRPWSRYSSKKQESSSGVENKLNGPKGSKIVAAKREIKKRKKDDGNDDPQFQEFLQVMQPRSKSKLWANDALIAPSLEKGKDASSRKLQVKGSHWKLDEPSAQFEGTVGNENILLENQKAVKADSLVHNEVVSDMDYFKSRIKKEWSDSESNGDADDSDVDDDSDWSGNSLNKNNHGPDGDTFKQEISEGETEDVSSEISSEKIFHSDNPSSSTKYEKEQIRETGRLYIRNLPYTAIEEELEEHFRNFGDISEVHIVVDKDTKRSKGTAFVLYALPESAARALEELNRSIFQGRILDIMPAKEKNSSDRQENNNFTQQSSKTLKQKRNEERKASEASGNTRGWNSLFMRIDTVVENIARKFGVSKSELLDREADDLAVRTALGETQVIAETKKALSKAGINVSSLEEFASGKTDGLKRSNHVILVKNLPYGSSESDLADMFGKFGRLDKVILPPTKTLALVIFVEAAEARASFEGCRYKRYKDAPLFLEWAPDNILSSTPTSMCDSSDNVIEGEHDSKRVLPEQQPEDITDMDVDPDRIKSRSVYVKNLNFKTSDENLKRHFAEHLKEGRILSVRVMKHLKNGKNFSEGFGFIEFDSVDTAVNVCRDLQETVLDGHKLKLQLCHAKKDEHHHKKVDRDKSSTKLIVKNVAFEATDKDLRQLFSPFGQVKSLRLPMKFGNHRGFAFVEYVTKQEAHNALQALSNTHLYGRHLVLERAKEGESLEELRAQTAAQFIDSTKLSKKRKRMAVLDDGNVKFQRIAD
ncbi:multiple RNA-binding domain-containing 1 isoform X1 [Olea europaea subsp. europaea]|nr:multiple RNA-binding domain-containing 1 isoform X1 [Olea europaea subsp. europaea]